MKVLKKLSILLALCMAAVLVFAACGPKGGGTTPTQKDEPQTEEVTTKEAEPEDTGYPEATLKGDTYTNEAINLQMKVPSTWTLYTKEQLADEYNGSATEPEIGESFYEAYALVEDAQFHENVSIIVQNSSEHTSTIKSMGIKSFTDLISEGIPDALEQAGATNVNYGLVDINFPLDDYATIQSTCSLQGSDIFQRQVVFLVGNYLYSITATSFDEAGVNEILGFFSKIK